MLHRATQALMIAAALAAVILAKRRADHRPFAVFVCVMALADVFRDALGVLAPIRPVGSPPFTGAARIAFHVGQALFLLWPAGLAALAMVLFAARRPRVIALAWVGAIVYLAANYPGIRGEALRRVYLGAQLAAVAVAVASFASFWQRHEKMTPARVCALLCLGIDGGTLYAGAHRHGFWVHWDLQQGAYIVLYSILLMFQGVLCFWPSPSPSP